jgi:hypothetical protein
MPPIPDDFAAKMTKAGIYPTLSAYLVLLKDGRDPEDLSDREKQELAARVHPPKGWGSATIRME